MTGKTQFSSNHFKGTYYQQNLTVDIDPDHLVEVVFVTILHCKVTLSLPFHLSLLHFVERSHFAQPILNKQGVTLLLLQVGISILWNFLHGIFVSYPLLIQSLIYPIMSTQIFILYFVYKANNALFCYFMKVFSICFLTFS